MNAAPDPAGAGGPDRGRTRSDSNDAAANDAPRGPAGGAEDESLNESRIPEELVEEGTPADGPEPATTPEPAGAAAEDAGAFQDRWLRAEAELQNYRRRSAKEIEEARRYAEEAVLLDLISLLDDLERGIDAARGGAADEAWLQGVELVAARMRDTLARRGVEVMDPVGRPFDPAEHEALLEVPAPEGMQAGDVAQVVLKGYRRGSRALRAARVVVARPPAEGEG